MRRRAANWTGSKAAGVIRSPYHFFDPTIDGVKQANHFLSVLSAAGGLQPGDLPPMLDIECPVSSNQATANSGSGANCEYTGNSGWVPTATLVQRIFDWLTTVEQATGRKALIYSYPAWFTDVGLSDARLARYPLYIATLASCASVPPPWTTTVFWQYSFTGTVSGITPQVDLDRFVGTRAELVAFANASARDAGSEAGARDGGAGDGGDGGDGGGIGAGVDAGVEGGALGEGGVNAAAADSAGCSCRVGSARAPAGWLGVALAAAALARRRRRTS